MAEVTVVKKVKNAVLRSDGTIRIDNVRLSYAHLDKPYAGTNDKGEPGEPKYSVVGLLPKKTHGDAKDLILKVIEDILKANKNAKIAKDKRFIGNGDDAAKEEYEGMYTVSARESRRPTCRNKDKSVIDQDEIADVLYSGCWANILIRPWFQDNKYGKRVNAGLVSVQFVRDDEAFGEGRINDDDAFDELDDDDSGFESGDFGDDGDDL